MIAALKDKVNPSGHLLDVTELAVSFQTATGDVKAVRGVNFYLDRGETLAIVGESGCGKSVTIQTIMRLNEEPPAVIRGGSILYKGEEITTKTNRKMRPFRGGEFAMIFQDAMTSLNPTMKVGKQLTEAIRTHQKISKAEAKRIAIEMFRKVGLPNPDLVYNRYPHTMSGGQRQRCMIAMALSLNPTLLFADEPTTALDVTIQAQILQLINQLKTEQNMGVIFITHNLGVVAKMADRVCVMYAGQIVEYGTLEDIFYRPKHPYTWGLLGSMPDIKKTTGKRLYSIPGTPPDLFSPPAGCGFAARCPYCMKQCEAESPKEYVVEDKHFSRCWLMDEKCTQTVVPPVGEEPFLKKEQHHV